MSAHPIHTAWSAVPVEPMNPLLDRQFVSGSNLTIARITLRKGGIVPLHSHANEQIAYLLSGCLKFLLFESGPSAAPREVLLRADELLVIPPNLPHEVHVLEDTINLDLFAPPRQDWINGEDAYLRR
jgi:quercetin dioxygenase-like cupin family protein